MEASFSLHLYAEGPTVEEKLENLPTGPGVYQHKDAGGTVLYVGKARNLRSRVRQYFQKSRAMDPRIEVMLKKATDLEIIVTDSEVEALILEANLIKKLKPRYNVSLKDDKSYPYIVITHEPYPRVFVTREIRRDGSRYFGPYTDVHNVRSALKAVRDLFMIRSCNYFMDAEVVRSRRIKVCLDYHIKKCEGPCEGLVSEEHYNRMIDQVASVLQGKTEGLIRQLQTDMAGLARERRFEEAAVIRDRIRGLEAYNEKQKVTDLDATDRDILGLAIDEGDACGVVFRLREGKMVGRRHYYLGGVDGVAEGEILQAFVQQYYVDAEDIPREILLPATVADTDDLQSWLSARRGETVNLSIPEGGEAGKLVRLSVTNAKFLLGELKLQKMKRAEFIPAGLRALQKDLRLDRVPRKIECFDISNTQGTDSVASMVVFLDGKPRKSEYRKFKIGTVDGPNDFASMREVIRRRYARVLEEHGSMPDLIMVDGGKGQLSSAVEVLGDLGIRNQPIIGLAKRLEEVFTPGAADPELVPKDSAGLRLLQQVRDEAHRFAITYHRSLRARRTLVTELHEIEGVGEKRARELLEAFGSVQGVKFATLEQLSAIVGERTAERIRAHFDGTEE
jgi:excinuclease ABC subunit C